MADFTPVRFVPDPIEGSLHAQALFTWGFKPETLRRQYPDFWDWTCGVSQLLRNSVARPVTWSVIYK